MKSLGVFLPIDAYLHTVGDFTTFIDDGSLDDTGSANLDMRQYHRPVDAGALIDRTSENSSDDGRPPGDDATARYHGLMAVPDGHPRQDELRGRLCTW